MSLRDRLSWWRRRRWLPPSRDPVEALDIIYKSMQDSYQEQPQPQVLALALALALTLALAQDSSAKQLTRDEPSVPDLSMRILMEGGEGTAAALFWDSFLTGELPEWNHRSHLRAGFFTLLDSLPQGQGVFKTAKVFLDHLKRLKELKPERFRDTEHRTMTIFWLYNLQGAILVHK